jgi:hypothetical protein
MQEIFFSLQSIHNGSEPTNLPIQSLTGALFPGVKWLKLETDCSFPSGVEQHL